jgi:uroporphyrinogen-III synthase
VSPSVERTDPEGVDFGWVMQVTFVATIVGGESEARRLASKARVACIGPVTAGTARELGIDVDVVADTYTIEGLVDALIRFFDDTS